MAGLFLLTFISVKLLLLTQGENIHRAKIYSANREVTEGGSLQVTCSTFGYTAKNVYLYVCHNGKAIKMEKQSNQEDITFIINSIEKDNSGNYSCVFSEDRLKKTQVMGYGENYIFIRVTESLICGEIRSLKSEVSEGNDAEFICTTSNQPSKMILAFLIKSGRIIQVNTWDTTETVTTFTLSSVRIEDAGTYSCVLMLNILPHPDKKLCGKNEVNLQITSNIKREDKKNSAYISSGEVRLAIVCFILLLFISLLLGIWPMMQKRGCLGWINERCLDNEEQLRETEVVYEGICYMVVYVYM